METVEWSTSSKVYVRVYAPYADDTTGKPLCEELVSTSDVSL